MALMPSTQRGRVLRFESSAVDTGTLFLTNLDGRESISRPYRFELEMWSARTDLDTAALLRQPAGVTIKQGVRRGGSPGVQSLRIHGVLASFEQTDTNADRATYRAVLVPRLWNLGLQTRCRIFLNKTVPQIVEEVLRDNDLSGEAVERRLTGTYPTREFVMQYHETDLAFLSRLLEHAGIFYFFKQAESAETLVLADSASAYEALANPETVPHGARRAAAGAGILDELTVPETVSRISLQRASVPREVVLRDYYDQDPGTDQEAHADVSPDGRGVHYEYGEHFTTAAEGAALAAVRAEEWRCRERIYTGRSTVRSFRAGFTFPLSEHPRSDFNASYVLTRVVHRAEQRFEAGTVYVTQQSYTNDFTAIPADLAYRPERTTPRPRVSGTIVARIDAAGDGAYAEIDDQGRYRVRFPLDLSGRGSGTASCPVRMAQPYAGAGMGMHFPLHAGTEVIVSFVNGDPDRPIITGAVPNPASGSPVVGGNQTQCVIATGGGNRVEMEDSDGGQRMTFRTPTEGTRFSMGAPNSPQAGFDFLTNAHYAIEAAGNAIIHFGGIWHSVIDEDVEWEVEGNVVERIRGNTQKEVVGSESLEVLGSVQEHINGMKSEFIGGIKHETVVGLVNDNMLAAHLETIFGVIVEVGYAAKCERLYGPEFGSKPAMEVEVHTLYHLDAGAKILMEAPNISAIGAVDVELKSGNSILGLNPSSAGLEAPRIGIKAQGELTAEGIGVRVKSEAALNLEGNNVVVRSESTLTHRATDSVDVDSLKFTVGGNAFVVESGFASIHGTSLEVS